MKAYAEWGEAFVEHLIGMFAVAIVERDTGRVVLARDRLGIKPLYLAEDGATVRFASTLPALLAGGGIDTGIDTVALAHYMSFHAVVPPPRTILAGVRKLPPATVRVYEPDGTHHERRYWDAQFARDPARSDWTETDWQDALAESLATAVRRRMVADVPVGGPSPADWTPHWWWPCSPSRGETGLSTFSIGFESVGGREGDEFQYSDVIAERFATDHHRILIPHSDLLPPLEAAVNAMAEPMLSHDAVAFYLLSGAVARHLKVVQSGQGADGSSAATTGTRRWQGCRARPRWTPMPRRSSTATPPDWPVC